MDPALLTLIYTPECQKLSFLIVVKFNLYHLVATLHFLYDLLTEGLKAAVAYKSLLD